MPSQPPNDPSAFRHLGRAQRAGSGLAVAGLVGVLILIAVPLYLWRRPKPLPPVEMAHTELDAGAPDAAPPPLAAEPGPPPKVVLTEARTLRCGGRSGRLSKERCDELPSIVDSLSRAIRENVACAPMSVSGYTVSFVLRLDFEKKKTHVWAGRSGTLKRHAASDLIRCVEHALPKIDWPAILHQQMRYEINVVASYPATTGAPLSVPSAPAPPAKTSLSPGQPTRRPRRRRPNRPRHR